MASPQTASTAAPAQGRNAYENVFRAQMRGDDRMAGRSATARGDFGRMVEKSSRAAGPSGSPQGSGGGFIAFIKTVIDIINPLQHIPVISTMYRHITGDEISPVARIAGGALFGGPVGLAAGVVNAAVAESTGKDIGENMLAMVTGDGKQKPPHKPAPAAPATMIAAADIIWRDAPSRPTLAETAPAPARTGRDIENQIRESRAAQLAALDSAQQFPSPRTPTAPQGASLRTGAGGNDGPRGGSLPSVPPAIQAKTGMLAPTQTPDRMHTGQTSGAGRSTAPDVGDRNPATHQAKATPVLQSQDAPAGPARRATAPEQIATLPQSAPDGTPRAENLGIVTPAADPRLVPQQMMAALDKYAALKKSQNAAAATGRLAAALH